MRAAQRPMRTHNRCSVPLAMRMSTPIRTMLVAPSRARGMSRCRRNHLVRCRAFGGSPGSAVQAALKMHARSPHPTRGRSSDDRPDDSSPVHLRRRRSGWSCTAIGGTKRTASGEESATGRARGITHICSAKTVVGVPSPACPRMRVRLFVACVLTVVPARHATRRPLWPRRGRSSDLGSSRERGAQRGARQRQWRQMECGDGGDGDDGCGADGVSAS